MNDLNINITQQNGVIDCNFDEIKEALKVQMTAYTDLEITEDGIKDAKADLATLRKIRKAFDDRRKEVKTEFMKPYNDFETEAKELLGIIDEPIGLIDSKLKSFEEKRIAEKQAHLHELYEQNIGELSEYLSFNAVYRDKWTNKTTTDRDIITDISEIKTVVMGEIAAIKALRSEIEEELLKVYKDSGNSLTSAIQKNSDYLAAKSLAEQKVREEQDKKALFEWDDKKAAEKLSEPIVATNDPDVFQFLVRGKENAEKAKLILSLEDIEFEEV